jgi:putative flippase GtrA
MIQSGFVPQAASHLRRLVRHPTGQKVFRYSIISVGSFLMTLLIIALAHGALRWSAFTSNILAWVLVTAPAYQITRRWAWSKAGKGHVWRELVPFWVIAAIGLLVSTWWAVLAESLAHHQHWSHSVQTAVIEVAVMTAYGVIWIARFVIMNKYIFVHGQAATEPAVATSGQVAP